MGVRLRLCRPFLTALTQKVTARTTTPRRLGRAFSIAHLLPPACVPYAPRSRDARRFLEASQCRSGRLEDRASWP
jgi:hypothetical protein